MQIIYLQRVGTPGGMVCPMHASLWMYLHASPCLQTMVSICTSWLSIGMGLKGAVVLKDLLPYQAKQTRKIKQLHAQLGGELGVA